MRSVSRDSRTGLDDARTFDEECAREVHRAQRYGRKLTLALLDVDDFRSVNDEFGHAAGDVLLVRVADQMRKVFRPHDVVARYGGDEFAILLPETALAEATGLCDALRKRLTTPVSPLTFTSALAELEAREDAQTFFRRADRALYRAKKGGGGGPGSAGVREPRRPRPPTLGATVRLDLDPAG
jgi:diguanylate cyclase (GGDEF)-like protein